MTKDCYAIKSVFAIGPFSILHLNSNKLTTSPFNVNEPFQNPNFTLEQVIEDIYTQTNGHAGLVCFCGRAIYRKLLSERRHLNYDIWQHFTTFSLGNEVLEYSTFIKMKSTLLRDDTDIKQAVRLLQTDFLANFDPVCAGMQNDLAMFLTAEGVLIPGEDAETYKVSSPLQIVPKVFLTSSKVEISYHPSTGILNILTTLIQVVCVFDQETIKFNNSFKIAHVPVNNANNREVPRESVYDAELYRVMSNWLSRFTVMGQWHLKYRAGGHINNKYVDIVILRSDHPTIALELLATATKKELKEYYE
ncbi:10657_t:CDS:2 [Gigaspora margarita]|uniref:10657_t:CDS:1 n=1 Tax=Gigaspora margarita TaxID=4874 RepID=A0ABM8W0Y0_GIGMA|nr:10657_t:CDS:2 [Gigaspora margarita]